MAKSVQVTFLVVQSFNTHTTANLIQYNNPHIQWCYDNAPHFVFAPKHNLNSPDDRSLCQASLFCGIVYTVWMRIDEEIKVYKSCIIAYVYLI